MSTDSVRAGSAISIFRFFSLVCGFGMLFAFVGYQWMFTNYTLFPRVIYLTLAVLLVLKGFGRLGSTSPRIARSTIARDGAKNIVSMIVGQRLARWMNHSGQRISLTREGMIYLLMLLFIGAGANLGRENALMLVFAMMAGPYVLNGWIIFNMLRKTKVSRMTARRVMAGETLSVQVRLTNDKSWLSSRLMVVRDSVQHLREVLDPAVLFVRIPPKASRIAVYQLQLMHRGRYRFGPLVVSSSFPLGLGERGQVTDEPDELIVHPRLGRLAPGWRRNFLRATELINQDSPRRGVFQDEFHTLREFRHGDNPRDIHWKTSARQQELVVREFRETRDHKLNIVLDLWSPLPNSSEDPAVEFAISFAATVCADHSRNCRDSQMRLAVVADPVTELSGRTGHACLEEILDALSLASGSAKHSAQNVMQLASRQSTAPTPTVIVTTRHQQLVDAIAAEDSGVSSCLPANTVLINAVRKDLEEYFVIE